MKSTHKKANQDEVLIVRFIKMCYKLNIQSIKFHKRLIIVSSTVFSSIPLESLKSSCSLLLINA